MMKTTRITMVATLAGLVVASIAWVCAAAPIMPRTAKITGEVRSLANLDKVRVKVMHSANLLRRLKYSPDRARKQAVETLAKAGIEDVDDDDAPQLNIIILIESHPKCPDVYGYTFHVTLEQKARIERLQEIHVVPTYAFVHGDLAHQDELLDDLDKTQEKILDRIISRIRLATREDHDVPS